MLINSTLKNWYLQNKRDLPWRNSSNPYHIWVSEVILQQTRIIQGLPYYERFILAFPDIKALAFAPQDKLMKLWQGLGYYSRARNLQKGAQFILEKHNGELPDNYTDLLSISGIGEYTASAIASIAFNLPYAVVDGNVNRVLSRVYGIFEPINQSEGKNKIKQIASEILDTTNPGLHNQALMEFGALCCVPNKPDCGICPIANNCYAYIHNKIAELPLKMNKAVVQSRYFYYLVVLFQSQVYIRKRTEKDIWHGLFEFPLIETKAKIPVTELLAQNDFLELIDRKPYTIIDAPEFFSHKLTHRNIESCFIIIETTGIAANTEKLYNKIFLGDIHKYPVSRLIHKFLEKKQKLFLPKDGM
jgi:A/G-specific adenine glycosylase